MPGEGWLIPPPSGGSFGCFTSPGRGSAETGSRLDSEPRRIVRGRSSHPPDGGPEATRDRLLWDGRAVGPPRPLSGIASDAVGPVRVSDTRVRGTRPEGTGRG